MNILILSGIIIEKPRIEIIEDEIKICHGIIAVKDDALEDYEYYLFISFDKEAEKIYKNAEDMMPVQFKGELKNYNYTAGGTKKQFSCVHVSESEFGISFSGEKKSEKPIGDLNKNTEKILDINEYWKKCLWYRERKQNI